MRLMLGTVQFGMDYGVSNLCGQIPKEEVFAILDMARKTGISMLDTSRDYGESEAVIGEYIYKTGTRFDIVSKMPVDSGLDVDKIIACTLQSLGVGSLYGYLLRGYDCYDKNPEIWNRLQEFKSNGIVKKVGFTLYHVAELEKISNEGLLVDLIQIPYSLFDRRFESSFEKLAAEGVEIHVRSVFLQGLVFQNPSSLRGQFQKVRDRIQRLSEIASEHQTSIAGLCVNYVMAKEFIDRILVGIESIQNLKSIIRSVKNKNIPFVALAELDGFREEDENITLPINWNS